MSTTTTKTLYKPEPTLPNLSLLELVCRVQRRLRSSGIQLIEWGAELQLRLGVPVILKDFTYLVSDEQLEKASGIVSDLGLPRSEPPRILAKTSGDLYTEGHLHRLTRSTLMSTVQFLHLFPASFASFMPSELCPATNDISSLPILVPRAPALYACLMRVMSRYPRNSCVRGTLAAQLELLIHYHLLAFRLEDGYVDTGDEEVCKQLNVDGRIADAIALIHGWSCGGEWREVDEEWVLAMEANKSGRESGGVEEEKVTGVIGLVRSDVPQLEDNNWLLWMPHHDHTPSDNKNIWMSILLYAATTAPTILACIAMYIAAPVTTDEEKAWGALTPTQLKRLLQGYVPPFIMTVVMTVDMAYRFQKLQKEAAKADGDAKREGFLERALYS